MSKHRMKGSPKALLNAMQKVLALLPPQEVVMENLEAIDELIAFLKRVREEISRLPEPQKREDVIKAATLLSNFLSSNVAQTLFCAKEIPQKITSASIVVDGAKIFNELKILKLEDIQQRLLDKKLFSLKELRTLAEFLQLGIDKKASRDTLADSVFKMGFANPRGYEDLRREAYQSLTAVRESKSSYK